MQICTVMPPSDHIKDLQQRIFAASENDFCQLALEVFGFQYEHNNLYKRYCQQLRINPASIASISEIPFLPIQFFKTQEVVSTNFSPEAVFESSGTTGSVNSRHFVKDLSLYENSFQKAFTRQYGDISQYCVLGLLPSYLERKNSSLVYMVDKLIGLSRHPNSGFYLYDTDSLYARLLENEKKQQHTLLIGVSYALLDFAERYPMRLSHTIVMETGGMKGRRKEISRQELHLLLHQQLGIHDIHSEYGMTELLSQAYSKGNGIFVCPPWMKIILRAEDDPFDLVPAQKVTSAYSAGAVNIVDLANIYSCSFIATDDTGKLYRDGSFEISGRLENSDIRGCGLMLIE